MLESKIHGGKATGNVLIIEDNIDTAEVIMTALMLAGYGVRIAKSRDEAVSQLRQNIYHIIILDYMMDGMSAQRFLSIVKIYSPLSKVILVTASGRPDMVAKNLGIEKWMKKPIHIDALRDMIFDLGGE